MIVTTDFETILNIWENYLWHTRVSKIETHSAMLLDRTYSMENFKYIPTFFVYMLDNQIVGCNSGHKCSDNTYRSRGLYVHENFRGKEIGVRLLEKTILQAKIEDTTCVWSYPRKSSWNTYSKAGFELCSDWEESELAINAYCKLSLR